MWWSWRGWRRSSSPRSSGATASRSARPSGCCWWRSACWPSGSRGCFLACTPPECPQCRRRRPASAHRDRRAGTAGLLFQGIQEFPAGLLAASAGLSADPAVLHIGMPLALIAAALADGYAGLQQRPDEAGVVLRLAADHPCGGGADIDAVQAQPDAPDHLGHVLLAQVSGVVGIAGLDAVAERVDRGGQHARVDSPDARVGVQHLPGVAHDPSRAAIDGDTTTAPMYQQRERITSGVDTTPAVNRRSSSSHAVPVRPRGRARSSQPDPVDRAPTAASSEPMAIPMNRFTVAVANFCDSGAEVLKGNMTATTVARPMIHPKKIIGRGVATSRRFRSAVASRATPAVAKTRTVVFASPYAPALAGARIGTWKSHRKARTPSSATSPATTAVATPPDHSCPVSRLPSEYLSLCLTGMVMTYLPRPPGRRPRRGHRRHRAPPPRPGRWPRPRSPARRLRRPRPPQRLSRPPSHPARRVCVRCARAAPASWPNCRP